MRVKQKKERQKTENNESKRKTIAQEPNVTDNEPQGRDVVRDKYAARERSQRESDMQEWRGKTTETAYATHTAPATYTYVCKPSMLRRRAEGRAPHTKTSNKMAKSIMQHAYIHMPRRPHHVSTGANNNTEAQAKVLVQSKQPKLKTTKHDHKHEPQA